MTRIEQRGAVAFTCMGVAVVVILLITLWSYVSRGRLQRFPLQRVTGCDLGLAG